MLTSFKKYLVWFVIGLSVVWSVSYATNNGSIWALFIDIAWNWKLMWDDIQDNTIDSSEIENSSILGIDIQDGSIEWVDIQDGTIEAVDLKDIYLNSSSIALNSEKLDGLDSTDFYEQVWNVQITSTWISTNTIELDEIILWGISITGALTTPSAPTVCVDYTWWPSTAEYCSGVSFVQISNCGNPKPMFWIKDCTVPSNLTFGVTKNFFTSAPLAKVGCVDVDIACATPWVCTVSWKWIGVIWSIWPSMNVSSDMWTAILLLWQTVESPVVLYYTWAENSCVVKWDSIDNNIKVYWKVQNYWDYWTYQNWIIGTQSAVVWYTLD